LTDTEFVHCVMFPVTSLLVLTAPTYGGMARLS